MRSQAPTTPAPAASIISPFTVVIDSREQQPYTFAGLRADARQGRRTLIVPIQRGTLQQGDYTLLDESDGPTSSRPHDSSIAIERKSLADLYQTLAQGRGRFERELARLADLPWAAVVVEADWPSILAGHPGGWSKLNPKTIYRSVIAWQQRYPRVHWWMVADRRMAEVTVYRMLERWWVDHGRGHDRNHSRTRGGSS